MGNSTSSSMEDQRLKQTESEAKGQNSRKVETQPPLAAPPSEMCDEEGDYLKQRKRTLLNMATVAAVFGMVPYLWDLNRRYQCTKYYLMETNPSVKKLFASAAEVDSMETAKRLMRQPYRFLRMPSVFSRLQFLCLGFILYEYVENSCELAEHEAKLKHC